MDRTDEGKRIRVGDRVVSIDSMWTPPTVGTVTYVEQGHLFGVEWEPHTAEHGEEDLMYAFELRHLRVRAQ